MTASSIIDELSSYIENNYLIVFLAFVIFLVGIVLGYWIVVRSEKKKKPKARERIVELRNVVAGLPPFAKDEHFLKLAEAEELYQEKKYSASLKLADITVGEVRQIGEVVGKARLAVGECSEKVLQARAKGLDVDEGAIGLAALKAELGGG